MVRKIDKLGRIVIPKDICRMLGIANGDPLEFSVEGSRICLRKYTQADVVEVVRCKDCKWYGAELSGGKHSCENFQLPYCLANDFCSHGERRGENGN